MVRPLWLIISCKSRIYRRRSFALGQKTAIFDSISNRQMMYLYYETRSVVFWSYSPRNRILTLCLFVFRFCQQHKMPIPQASISPTSLGGMKLKLTVWKEERWRILDSSMYSHTTHLITWMLIPSKSVMETWFLRHINPALRRLPATLRLLSPQALRML